MSRWGGKGGEEGGGLPFLVELGARAARLARDFDFGVDAEGGGGAFLGGLGGGGLVGGEVGGEGVGERHRVVVEEGVEVVAAACGGAVGRVVRRHVLDWEVVLLLAILRCRCERWDGRVVRSSRDVVVVVFRGVAARQQYKADASEAQAINAWPVRRFRAASADSAGALRASSTTGQSVASDVRICNCARLPRPHIVSTPPSCLDALPGTLLPLPLRTSANGLIPCRPPARPPLDGTADERGVERTTMGLD